MQRLFGALRNRYIPASCPNTQCGPWGGLLGPPVLGGLQSVSLAGSPPISPARVMQSEAERREQLYAMAERPPRMCFLLPSCLHLRLPENPPQLAHLFSLGPEPRQKPVPGLSPSWPCPVAKSHPIPEAPQLEPVPSLTWGKPCSQTPLPQWNLLILGLQLSPLALGPGSALYPVHGTCCWFFSPGGGPTAGVCAARGETL